MREMRVEDGPSLSLAGNLCWTAELQAVPSIFELYQPVLLVGLLHLCNVGLGRYLGR